MGQAIGMRTLPWNIAPRSMIGRGIDIWRRGDFGIKVSSVIWHGDAAMVVSYRSGPWERALHRAAAGVRRGNRVMQFAASLRVRSGLPFVTRIGSSQGLDQL